MSPVSRYHPLLVTLHWLLALLLITALVAGFFQLATTPNSDPHKVDLLRLHMAGGMFIFALMLIRFIVRLRSAKPAALATGNPNIDRLVPLAHYGFYALVLLMVATGYSTGILAGLPAIVFAHSGAPLPHDFLGYPTRIAHGILAFVLSGLIALHIAAALWHQFIKKDRLFRRMFYGQRG